jgi:hypothetical protein
MSVRLAFFVFPCDLVSACLLLHQLWVPHPRRVFVLAARVGKQKITLSKSYGSFTLATMAL